MFDPEDFIERLAYDDMCVDFRERKIDFLGCYVQTDAKGNETFCLRVYDPATQKYLFNTTKPSQSECIEAFLDAPIFGGQKFYDVEKQMEITDDWDNYTN